MIRIEVVMMANRIHDGPTGRGSPGGVGWITRQLFGEYVGMGGGGLAGVQGCEQC